VLLFITVFIRAFSNRSPISFLFLHPDTCDRVLPTVLYRYLYVLQSSSLLLLLPIIASRLHIFEPFFDYDYRIIYFVVNDC